MMRGKRGKKRIEVDEGQEGDRGARGARWGITLVNVTECVFYLIIDRGL